MSDIDTMALEQALVGTADQEIVVLEARIRAAQLGADITALNELISDDLLFTGPDGQLGTKAQDIEAYRSGMVKFLVHVPQELRIRRVGANVAISSLRAELTVDVAGNISRGMFRYTRVWAREDDQLWRVVGGHVSLVNALDSEEAGQHEATS
jgi:ketosteroid isomerase-like protein